jgi:hypothetical protein
MHTGPYVKRNFLSARSKSQQQKERATMTTSVATTHYCVLEIEPSAKPVLAAFLISHCVIIIIPTGTEEVPNQLNDSRAIYEA